MSLPHSHEFCMYLSMYLHLTAPLVTLMIQCLDLFFPCLSHYIWLSVKTCSLFFILLFFFLKKRTKRKKACADSYRYRSPNCLFSWIFKISFPERRNNWIQQEESILFCDVICIVFFTLRGVFDSMPRG